MEKRTVGAMEGCKFARNGELMLAIKLGNTACGEASREIWTAGEGLDASSRF